MGKEQHSSQWNIGKALGDILKTFAHRPSTTKDSFTVSFSITGCLIHRNQ